MKRRNSNFIAFDLGSSKIAALVASVDNHGEVDIYAQLIHSSNGIKSGMIVNMESAENSIVNAIYTLEKECDKSIKEVAISLSGANVKSYYVNQSLKVTGQTITAADVTKLIQKALANFKLENQQVIHYFPIEFKINGNQIVENPVGLYGQEVFCQLHIIAAESTMIMNLVQCFSKIHVGISNIIVGIYASALSTVSENEMEVGTTIIEMGASTTSYALILKGKPIYVNYVPIGGYDITLSIARALSISVKEAEKLKIIYGNASAKLISKDIIVELENQTRSVTAKQIADIISPIVEDIFTQIKKQCDNMSLDHLAAQQIIITGGGAALAGIKHCASNIFHKQIKIGKCDPITGFVESYNPLSHSTLIGMIKFKIEEMKKSYYDDYLSVEGGLLKKMFTWVRNNI